MTPIESPLHHITDVISYNHYFGWYGGKMEENGPWMDNFHKVHPDLCLGLSEYGCEGIVTYHGPNPACKITVRNIRRFTMSTWRRCWRNARDLVFSCMEYV